MSPRAGLTAERVVDAAEAIADRNGFQALTLHAVASALGVRPPSLYNHVAGLDGIRRALHLRGLQLQQAAYTAALNAAVPGTRLRALCHAQRAIAAERPSSYAAAQPSAHLPDTDEELRERAERLLALIMTAVAELGLDGDEALHAVRVVRSAVHGFISLEAAGAFGMAIDVESSFDRLITTLEAGLSATG